MAYYADASPGEPYGYNRCFPAAPHARAARHLPSSLGGIMIGFLLGLVLVLAKFFDVEPVASWSWWIVVLPIVGTVIYYEVIEKMFDLRRKAEDKEKADRHKERIAKLQGLKKK
jgi:small Trp-rich protein